MITILLSVESIKTKPDLCMRHQVVFITVWEKCEDTGPSDLMLKVCSLWKYRKMQLALFHLLPKLPSITSNSARTAFSLYRDMDLCFKIYIIKKDGRSVWLCPQIKFCFLGFFVFVLNFSNFYKISSALKMCREPNSLLKMTWSGNRSWRRIPYNFIYSIVSENSSMHNVQCILINARSIH